MGEERDFTLYGETSCSSSGTGDDGLSRRLTILSNSSQRCSIGLRSGENAGHGKTSDF
jgi:hypothetical protein